MTAFSLSQPIITSAPCRVDLGGTLDLASFYMPLAPADPATFHMALDMRTRVTLSPWAKGRVRIESRGFEPAEFDADALPFAHPMGLMFGMAAHFGASGVKIEIDSASPPRSALGGSSVAAVALAAAFYAATGDTENMAPQSARIAFQVECAVAGVVCGIQDHMAAAFGGASLWRWRGDEAHLRDDLLVKVGQGVSNHLAVAYCGIPHDSLDINGKWVRGFLSGETRKSWLEIIGLTHTFARAFGAGEWGDAADAMNRETDIRLDLTPDVLDPVGKELVSAARKEGCGARFTGAGGGGCLWALGDEKPMERTRQRWQAILDKTEAGSLLSSRVTGQGVRVDS